MRAILISSRESLLHSCLAMLALSSQIELVVVQVSFGSCQHEPPLLDTGRPVSLVAPLVGPCLAWAFRMGSSSCLVRPAEEDLMEPCDIGAPAPSPSMLHIILHMAFITFMASS